MLWLFKSNDLVRQYQHYRTVFRELNHKIIKTYFNRALIEKSARMLKLGQNNQLALDSVGDLDVLMDFALYEIRQTDGKNFLERYAEENHGDDAIERNLLMAMLKARTGLFKVSKVLKNKRQMVCENLTLPEASAALTDINLAKTIEEGLIVFMRPICMSKFTMTSGIAFVFPSTLEQELLHHWKRFDAKSNADRYAWFFKKSKQSGLEIAYR